ncbi:Cu(I)-responsive transcriptional regulator [Sphingomonas sp.]|uniref:Cu(I)-responsive transcriptional regulator n=1 Tax=Sphingomonas sp. TaxID=28214 RepID=UPI00286C573E|nr:Cu(I)-responsive transcriptional regulator [Sphingomonas sp.]
MKIGKVSSASGVSQRMIRHYEKIGLIPEAARRDSGYRDYDDRDLHTLRFIGRARDLGFPIEDIRALLALWIDRGRSSADVKLLALARATELRKRISVLDGMRRTLEHLAASCHGDNRPDCPILHDLEEGGHEPTR